MDKKPEECKAGAPEWMVTYGDLVTLLMCFFVLLFAFSEIDAQKFEAVMQSFQGSAGVLEGGKSLSEDPLVFQASPESDTTPETQDSEPMDVIEEFISEQMEQLANQLADEISEQLEEEFEGGEFDGEFEIIFEGEKLIIRLPNSVLFDSAKADIKPEAIPILATLAELLQDDIFEGSDITIEGHTDNVPINTERFPDNWYLSSARAISVLQYFTEEYGYSENELGVAAYGEWRPIESNNTVEGRAANRRVEIIIEEINLFNISEESEEEGDRE